MKFVYTQRVKGTIIEFTEGDTIRFVEREGKSILVIGIGKREEVERRELMRLIRKVVRVAREQKLTELSVLMSDFMFSKTGDIDEEELGRLVGENMLLANYEFTKFKTKKKDEYDGVRTVAIHDASSAFKKGVAVGEIVAQEINFCRDLSNTPGGDMTPTVLASAAKQAAKNTSIKVTILEKKDVQKLGMGLILGVDQGSVEPLKFIVMEYWGAGKTSTQKPIVLVGKGITFDTGGINLKPSDSILGMHHDMAGGASVIGAITVAAKLELKKNVISIIPAVENAISGSAYRPGDVLKAMNGTTVEVLNTDAEGRLVLGDALTYVERYAPRLVVDVATLTGAALVALGTRASALMTRDSHIETTLRELGEVSGDLVWPLPLWKEYEADINGNVADIANIPTQGNTRYGGSINGGTFLAKFATAYPWAHIDMAPRVESIPENNLAKGATGEPVRLLVRLIEEY